MIKIGYRPANDPLNQVVRACFKSAGFQSIRLGLNKDMSMLTFWMKPGTYPPLKTERQARLTFWRLLRDAGVVVKMQEVAVRFDGDRLLGAFTPPDSHQSQPG